MNILITPEQYNKDFVYFCDPIKNVIMDGHFIRILYSNALFTLNGIYLLFSIQYESVDKYFNNKLKYTFNPQSHQGLIQTIRTIEEDLLQKVNIRGKQPVHKMYEQIKYGTIKVFSNTSSSSGLFSFKIAGIWETSTEYGLTYKISNL
jgi:hypothetical protein